MGIIGFWDEGGWGLDLEQLGIGSWERWVWYDWLFIKLALALGGSRDGVLGAG